MFEDTPLFTTDLGKITDFSKVTPAEIFNKAVIPHYEAVLKAHQNKPVPQEDVVTDYNAPLTIE